VRRDELYAEITMKVSRVVSTIVVLSSSLLLLHLPSSQGRNYTCEWQPVVAGPAFNFQELQGVWYEQANTATSRGRYNEECACGTLVISSPQQGGGDAGGQQQQQAQCSAFEQNTDYPGNDIKEVPMENPEGCCNECRNTPGCTLFVHASARCVLKTGKGQPASVEGAVAATLQQPGGGDGTGQQDKEEQLQVQAVCVTTGNNETQTMNGTATFPWSEKVGAVAINASSSGNGQQEGDNEETADQERQRLYPGGADFLILDIKRQSQQNNQQSSPPTNNSQIQYIVVGAPCYLDARILSTQPQLPDEAYNEARATLRAAGYPLRLLDLNRTRQQDDVCQAREAWLQQQQGGGGGAQQPTTGGRVLLRKVLW